MKLINNILFTIFAISAIFTIPVKASEEEVISNWYKQAEVNKPSELLYMELKYGTVVIKLLPNVAPNHVARIKELVKEGFYNGLSFHRVIPGFMAQGGDPTGTGAGGTGMIFITNVVLFQWLEQATPILLTASFLSVLTMQIGLTVNTLFGEKLYLVWNM